MKKTKIILFDIDGVLINIPHYFGVELEKRGYKSVTESLSGYYYGEACEKCTEGEAETKELIQPFLDNFGWKEGSEEYLKQQFEFEGKYVDNELISYIENLRSNGIKCFLASDQEKNRAKYLLEECNLENSFDGDFMSCDIGSRKTSEKFWEHVLKHFPEINPEEIVFFDDRQGNIDIAKSLGIQAFLYTDINNFYKDINTLK